MSARLAVKTVMIEWSGLQRRSAKLAQRGVIKRQEDPTTLDITDIAELWAQPGYQTGIKPLGSSFYYVLGLVLLFAAKAKHTLQGYRTPKPGVMDDQQCIHYDMHIADTWLDVLDRYVGTGILHGANVLELGPGSDLGTGIYLVAKGARTYCALDAFNLAGKVPREFYDAFISQIAGSGETAASAAERQRLTTALWGPTKVVDYVVDPTFDVATALKGRSFDIIFSNAAFEHFDNVEKTLMAVSSVAKKNAALVCCVDLMTHTRWIRKRDPNNIYRYSDRLYSLAAFKGIPNRIRPHQYKTLLEEYGWENVTIIPDLRLYGFDTGSLARRFRDPINAMDLLTITIVATKRG